MLAEECKVVSNTAFMKTRGTNRVYEDAIEASSKFNKNLIKDRKTRLPFLDSQTTVAQSNCNIWPKEYQRIKPQDPSILFSYKSKRWYKRRRIQLEHSEYGMPLFRQQSHHQGIVDLSLPTSEIDQLSTFILNSQHIAYTPAYKPPPPPKPMFVKQMNKMPQQQQQQHQGPGEEHFHVANMMKTNGVHPDSHGKTNGTMNGHHSNNNHGNHPGQPSHPNHSNHGNSHSADWHMNEDENSKHDGEEDSDDDEESKRKKNAKKGGRSRKNPFDADGIEKNFVCDVCGAKYKTRPGLSYHVQKTHNMRLAVNPTGNGSPMAVPMNKITRENIDSMNGDDNTNSIFESVYDGDNSSSMPQGSQSASTPLNQNTNSSQAISNKPAGTPNAPVKCGVCFCIEPEPRGQPNKNDKFITCSECSKQFHPTSCLGFNAAIMESIKKYKWLCIECKRCTVCGNSENDDKLLFCDDCDRGYHVYCLTPPLTEAPEGDWRCDLCKAQTNGNGSVTSAPPAVANTATTSTPAPGVAPASTESK